MRGDHLNNLIIDVTSFDNYVYQDRLITLDEADKEALKQRVSECGGINVDSEAKLGELTERLLDLTIQYFEGNYGKLPQYIVLNNTFLFGPGVVEPSIEAKIDQFFKHKILDDTMQFFPADWTMPHTFETYKLGKNLETLLIMFSIDSDANIDKVALGAY